MGKATQKGTKEPVFHHERWPFSDYGSRCLFNTEGYLESSMPDRNSLFRYSLSQENKSVFSFHYSIMENRAYAGRFSSFVLPERSPGISFKKVQNSLDHFVIRMKENGVKSLSWMHFPRFYDDDLHAMISQSLLNLGFIIEGSDINSYLSVGEKLELLISASAKRRLNKAEKEGIRVSVKNDFDPDEFYDILTGWRKKRAHGISISRETLRQLKGNLPTDYILFEAYLKERKIGLALGVRLTKEVFYYFLPGSDPDYDKSSPAIPIIKAMYDYSGEHNMRVLDLGTSSAMKGVENFNLIRFKEKMGSKSDLKIHFYKELI